MLKYRINLLLKLASLIILFIILDQFLGLENASIDFSKLKKPAKNQTGTKIPKNKINFQNEVDLSKARQPAEISNKVPIETFNEAKPLSHLTDIKLFLKQLSKQNWTVELRGSSLSAFGGTIKNEINSEM